MWIENGSTFTIWLYVAIIWSPVELNLASTDQRDVVFLLQRVIRLIIDNLQKLCSSVPLLKRTEV